MPGASRLRGVFFTMDDKRKKDLDRLQESLALSFRDISLLDTALTHSSFANENPGLYIQDNERLEYLGDAVLQLCVSDLLVRRYATASEGMLSKLRASLVREKTLAAMGERCLLGRHLRLGKGELSTGGRHKSSILADTFEAFLAALYLDGGYKTTRTFVHNLFQPILDSPEKMIPDKDAKSLLQEFCQGTFKTIPRYHLVAESGPDHDKTFQIRVSLKDSVTATGFGKNKKEAEQNAALKALQIITDMKAKERMK